MGSTLRLDDCKPALVWSSWYDFEWAACTELDPDTDMGSATEITSIVGLSDPFEFHWSTGNSTALQLEGGVPYWFAAVCVDEAGQYSVNNAK